MTAPALSCSLPRVSAVRGKSDELLVEQSATADALGDTIKTVAPIAKTVVQKTARAQMSFAIGPTLTETGVWSTGCVSSSGKLAAEKSAKKASSAAASFPKQPLESPGVSCSLWKPQKTALAQRAVHCDFLKRNGVQMIQIDGVVSTLRNAKRSRSPLRKSSAQSRGPKRTALHIASCHDDAKTAKKASNSTRGNTLPRRFVQQSDYVVVNQTVVID